MHLRRQHPEETPHSHLMHPGDPPECYYLHHRDGSFSHVRLSVEGDNLRVELRQSDTHEARLGGL